MVGGNHDLGCVGKVHLDWFNETARTAIMWTRDRLSFPELDALRRLPLTMVVEPFTLVHGTLSHPERFEYLVDMAQAVDSLTVCRTLLCLMGHTHVPIFIEFDRTARRLLRMISQPDQLDEITYVDDAAARRYLVNPGSVGQPRDGDPRASCAIIDTERHQIGVRRCPYDVAAAQRKIRAAGLPGFLADRLSVGR